MKHIAVIAGYEYRFIEMFSSVEDSSQFVLRGDLSRIFSP